MMRHELQRWKVRGENRIDLPNLIFLQTISWKYVAEIQTQQRNAKVCFYQNKKKFRKDGKMEF